ncbi:LamG domain-containing protein [Planctomycetota bacterium]
MCKKLLFLASFVLVLGLILTSAAKADLIGWWKFDEGSGNTAFDSSGYANDGTLGGDPQWGEGYFGGGLELDGSDYVAIDGVVDDITSTDITLSIWIKSTQTGQGDLFAANDSASGHPLEFYIDGGYPGRYDGGDTNYPTAPQVADDEWHMMTYVRDGNTGYIYVDGVLAVTYSASFSLSSVTRWSIGQEWDDATPSNFYTGLVDDARFYNHPLSEGEVQSVMVGEGFPLASRPNPSDGSFIDDTWVSISWRSGDFAVSHDVYLSDNFDDVSNGTGDAVRGNQTSTELLVGFPGFAYPEGLVPGTTYYWRIDEVNDADPNSPWRGDVWSFSVPPKNAYNPDPADGAEFVGPDNVTLSWTPGFRAKLHTVYFGDDFDTVNTATAGTLVGPASYNAGMLEAEKVYYWRVDEFDPPSTYKGDVWSFTTPGAVGNPQPVFDAANVQMNAILSWTEADSAASHELYFGTDPGAVRSADTSSPEYIGSKALGAESHDPGLLEPDTTYYWRVDEVDAQGNTLTGPLWIFTTGDSLLVDDFEGYTDDDAAGEAIWQTWVDGFGVPDNGAQVGYFLPPYAEQTVVHGGLQSMPLMYANEAGVTNSEASMTLSAPRDWTQAGVAELSLWLRGDAANAADPLYVAVSNAAGAPAVVANDDAAAAVNRRWTQWRIPLQALADQGITLTNVDKIAIGVGSKGGAAVGGSGTIYIDDIRLYRP